MDIRFIHGCGVPIGVTQYNAIGDKAEKSDKVYNEVDVEKAMIYKEKLRAAELVVRCTIRLFAIAPHTRRVQIRSIAKV